MRSMRNAKVKKNIIGDVTDCPNLAPLVPTEERVIAKHRLHLLFVVAVCDAERQAPSCQQTQQINYIVYVTTAKLF